MAKDIEIVKSSTLVKAANIFAKAVRKFAPYAAIKRSVKVGAPSTTRGGNKNIIITVGNKSVPYARAFDLGSGIHAQKGRRGTYRILPKTGQALGIPRSRWKNFRFPLYGIGYNKKKDKLIVRAVDHPGVRGVNYVNAARNSVRKEISQLVKMEASQSIRTYLKAQFLPMNKK